MRARGLAGIGLAAVIVLAGAVGAAVATDPVELGSRHLLDDVDVLSAADEQTADERLQALSEATDVDLWVVFVDDFTNPSDRIEWADRVAQAGGLGTEQYLLAIATEGRQFYISSAIDAAVADDRLGEIEDSVAPLLGDGDWLGAVETAADGFEGGQDEGISGVITVVLWVVVIAVAGWLIIWFLVRSRRKKAAAADDEPDVEQLSVQDLERRAGSALVQTDDAVRTSEQELGFAVAQFGRDATGDFEAALAEAKRTLGQAFELQQKLDDVDQDTEQDTRAWNMQIVQLCETATTMLDEKAQAFEELRELERNAPEALARTQEARAAASAAPDETSAALRQLSSRYAAEALGTVIDNADEARSRLEFADTELADAQQQIGAGRGGEAAVSIHAAEQAIGQATALHRSVTDLEASLAAGEKQAAELIADLEQDIAAAGSLPDDDGRVAAAITAAAQQIDRARQNLAGDSRRPLVTLESLQAANTQLDAVSQGIRDAAARERRTRQVLDQTMLQAQSRIAAAEDFITSRRGAVGAAARTRVAEAGAALGRAQRLQTADPQQALTDAQQAARLAAQGIDAARGDIRGFGGGMIGGYGGSRRGGLDNLVGGMLGGIVGSAIVGGSRRSGGWGSSRGGLGGGIFGGGRSGRRGGGSFGGRRAGRRGGGRF